MYTCTQTHTHTDEEGDMDVRDRGMLYYRLLKYDVREAQRVVCGQTKVVAEENTVIPRVSCTYMYDKGLVPVRLLPFRLLLFRLSP